MGTRASGRPNRNPVPFLSPPQLILQSHRFGDLPRAKSTSAARAVGESLRCARQAVRWRAPSHPPPADPRAIPPCAETRPDRWACHSVSPVESRYRSRPSHTTRPAVHRPRSSSVTCWSKNQLHPRPSSEYTVVSSRERFDRAHTISVQNDVMISESEGTGPGGRSNTWRSAS